MAEDMARYEVRDDVATVTMNRPDRLNTMTDAFLEDVLEAVERAADESVRAVVFTGEGRAFCAGGDLREGIGGGVGGAGSIVEASGRLRRYMRIAQLLHDMPKPTIAAVRGACAGAGFSLACAADFRIAGNSAVFATAFLGVGLSGDFGGTWLMTKLIGSAKAREAYLLGGRLSAEQALGLGLVTEVVADDDVAGRAHEIAARLAAGPDVAIRLIKANLNDAEHVGFSEALEREALRHITASRDPQAAEATQAFLDKCTPVFTRKA